MGWTKIDKELPKENQLIITWGSEGMKLCIYKKKLTWSGYEFKFCNYLSKWQFVDDTVTHWTCLPAPPTDL